MAAGWRKDRITNWRPQPDKEMNCRRGSRNRKRGWEGFEKSLKGRHVSCW